MAFSSAATIIYAYTFNLVDPNGIIIAALGTNTQEANNQSLLLLHNDSLTTDSYLYWSSPARFGAGHEEVVLQGPKLVGSPGVGPGLVLSKTTGNVELAQIQGAQQANIITATDAGNVAGPSLLLDALAGTVALSGKGGIVNVQTTNATIAIATTNGVIPTAEIDLLSNGDIQSFHNTFPVADINGVSRGTIYGVSFHQANLAANTVVGGAAWVTILTINLPNAPVLGAEIDVSYHASADVLILNGADFQFRALIDGVTAFMFSTILGGVPAGTPVGTRETTSVREVAGGLAVGTHTIQLQAIDNGAANNFRIFGGYCGLTVAYYR